MGLWDLGVYSSSVWVKKTLVTYRDDDGIRFLSIPASILGFMVAWGFNCLNRVPVNGSLKGSFRDTARIYKMTRKWLWDVLCHGCRKEPLQNRIAIPSGF